MVFLGVCESGQKLGNMDREASGGENHRFRMILIMVFRMVREGGQTGNIGRETSGGENHRFGLHTESRPHTESIQ